MADLATLVEAIPSRPSLVPRKTRARSSRSGIAAFLIALVGGVGYIGVHVAKDLNNVTVLALSLSTGSTTRPTLLQQSFTQIRWNPMSL